MQSYEKILYIIAAGLLVALSSCGNKFNIGEKLAQMLGKEDTTAVVKLRRLRLSQRLKQEQRRTNGQKRLS